MNDLDWFHCNRCFGDVESHPEQTSFHLTTCGHIFCKSCLNQGWFFFFFFFFQLNKNLN